MTEISWLEAWWSDLSPFVASALLIATMALTWLACEWAYDNWRLKFLVPFLFRREYARMDRERKRMARAAPQSAVASTADGPRAVAGAYRVRAGEFNGTTRISFVSESGLSSEQNDEE